MRGGGACTRDSIEQLLADFVKCFRQVCLQRQQILLLGLQSQQVFLRQLEAGFMLAACFIQPGFQGIYVMLGSLLPGLRLGQRCFQCLGAHLCRAPVTANDIQLLLQIGELPGILLAGFSQRPLHRVELGNDMRVFLTQAGQLGLQRMPLRKRFLPDCL